MNVAEAAHRVGEALKKTDKGRELTDLINKLVKTVSSEVWDSFHKLYVSGGKRGLIHYYSLTQAYSIIEGHKDNEELPSFLKGHVESILSINDFQQLADLGNYFGKAIDELILNVMGPMVPKEFAGETAKPKLKRAIQDLHVSFQRTGLLRYMMTNVKDKQEKLSIITSSYNARREPFSLTKANRRLIRELSDNRDDRKILLFYEIFGGMLDFIKQLIFETHINEIVCLERDTLIKEKIVHLHGIDLFMNKNYDVSILGRGHIILIKERNQYRFGLMKERSFSFNRERGGIVSIKGYLYPEDDNKIFELQSYSKN
ncbi:hypothetical protein P4311_07590 [Bacillus thuringiensis]|nr:hypothetical protein [Bacillus thuringiensis]